MYCPHKHINFIKGIHGQSPPDVTGKNVLLCDFAYRKHHMVNMLSTANKILIIDHHKSAAADLASIDNKYKIFDINRSGAALTWLYVFPEYNTPSNLPLLIQHIEDRDIWKLQLPMNDEFVSWFYIDVPFQFEEYEKYLDDQLLKHNIETNGTIFRRLNNNYIRNAVQSSVVKLMYINDNYYIVSYVNSTILKSDIGNQLCIHQKYIDFAVVYSIDDAKNNTMCSLRSSDNQCDVSSISFALGGGGHRNASGVTLAEVTNILPGQVFDHSEEIYKSIQNARFTSKVLNDCNYNVIHINSNVHQVELCKYLLQTMYVNTHGATVDRANSIRMRQMGICGQDVTTLNNIDIVAVWHDDDICDETTVTTHCAITTTAKTAAMATIMVNSNLSEHHKELICETLNVIPCYDVDYCGVTVGKMLL